jgi:hypothetical protein
MKNRKRNLKEEQRKHYAQVGLCLLASAERLTEEGRKAERRPTAEDVLYVAKIMPNWNTDPGAVAKYLYHELRCSPSLGARKVAHCIELGLRMNEQGFVVQMRRALRDYQKQRQPVFVAVDVDAVKIKIQQPHIRYSELLSKLEKLHPPPNVTRDSLERRVSRLFKPIPKEWNIKSGCSDSTQVKNRF